MRSNLKTKTITIQDKIIEKYLQILKEYFDMLGESKYIHELPNPVSNMYIGLNAIYRVFEYIFIHTKNLEKVEYYSKKTCYYYLEYMEQIYSSNLTQNLNQMDAILFVYKKTIFDLYNGESEDSYGTMTNIITLNNDTENIENIILKPMLKNISKTMNVLFYWGNKQLSFLDRKEISRQYLEEFIKLVENKPMVLVFLEAVQKHNIMAFPIYVNLLKELLEFYNKKRKTETLDDNQLRDWEFDRFYIHRDEFHEKICSGNMKNLIEWTMLCL